MSNTEDDTVSSFTLELQKFKEQMKRFKEITDQKLCEDKDDLIGDDWSAASKLAALALDDQRHDMYITSDFTHRKQVAPNAHNK